ncbi:EAL domain-containing protein [Butyrivibrio sp. YAB3001]|uniref:EAL domain-containing protein n=1 Tax=Butyrivibrio sp. YAB3001 TaxID=1520812 RepID=UPI001588219A|nr:EAL domain-containing protein [Butyrivibrio sp. YAB3001]
MSIILTAAVMCVYVYSKTTKRIGVQNMAILISFAPAMLAFTAIFFRQIEFGVNDKGIYYNYGPVIGVCYIIGFMYIIVAIIRVVFLRDRLSVENFTAIIVGLGVWAVLAAFQFIKRDMQVSSVATMLMELILFLSMENPKEFYERSIDGIRNRDAFNMVLPERFGPGHKSFFVISVIFTGKTAIMSNSDRIELAELMKNVGKISENKIGVPAYLFNWNTLCSIIYSPEKVESFMTSINNIKDSEGKNYRLTFSVLDVQRYANGAEQVIQILNYVSGEYVYTQSSPNLVIDQNVVDKMIFRNTIEDVVRQAVKEKAFEVYYQPILCVETGKFSSAEALVRLKHPDTGKFVSPEDFIPIAEKCGLILEIDDLVFEKVCSFIARENLPRLGIKIIEVNLSGNEVVDEQTHVRLLNKMEKYHIPPQFINFEITETSYISNDEVFLENVKRLKAVGSSFSMDDFGSGYSNLLEILKMDYALVKLDKEFVWNCLDITRPENMKMLEYTINFLKDFGLHILAEGVENLDQAKILVDKGVEYLQGFYYSKAIPENEYIDFLKAQKGMFESTNV